MIVGGRECVIAGCHARGYLEIDHSEIDHAKGGPAAWWNLDYGCSVHHDARPKAGNSDPATQDRQTNPHTPRGRVTTMN